MACGGAKRIYKIFFKLFKKKKPVVDTCSNLDASQGHYAEYKKINLKISYCRILSV